MDFKLIKELFDIEDNSFGISELEILESEKNLGIRFPKVLREYYKKLGNHENLNYAQNELVSLENLKIDKDGILEFYAENQYVVSWGINVNELPNDNPKVYMDYGSDWELDSANLSSFLESMAFYQAIFASRFHANYSMMSKEEIKIVEENFEKIEGVFTFWKGKFYRNKKTELIAIFSSHVQSDLFVTAKNKEDFESAINMFNVNWDYNSERDE